jgi:hypothetical protein
MPREGEKEGRGRGKRERRELAEVAQILPLSTTVATVLELLFSNSLSSADSARTSQSRK